MYPVFFLNLNCISDMNLFLSVIIECNCSTIFARFPIVNMVRYFAMSSVYSFFKIVVINDDFSVFGKIPVFYFLSVMVVTGILRQLTILLCPLLVRCPQVRCWISKTLSYFFLVCWI